MNDYIPWLILFLPLLAAVLIALFGLKERVLSPIISVGAICSSFCLSLILGSFVLGTTMNNSQNFIAWQQSLTWLEVGRLHVDFGLVVDPLSMLMLLVVTGVGGLIHIYSMEYMKDDRGYTRFFACLSFFTFSMLGIVLSNNLFQMFIFWELVGVSSYMLVGFWYEKPSAADAAKKAFLTNRIGDFGFLCGIIMIWAASHSLNFTDLERHFYVNPKLVGTIGGLLIFCGAVGKSAQFPLHVWLPDAMEGPTPVSALIHAATMVAAGVYMLCRVFFVFDPTAQTVIAWIGGGTALMAALIAVQQNDIKRILAYSTLSQLGYMVMATGLSNRFHDPDPRFYQPAAMFHLATHACFKALLFLGAGSVIYAMHHEQDIWKMGQLKKKMPITTVTFLIGTLALCGVPPFSGFYSKDAILAAAAESNPVLYWVGVGVAFLTTFYMFRLVLVVFGGKAKSEAVSHAHESPGVMTMPLAILAVASVVVGVVGIEQFIAHRYFAPEENYSLVDQVLGPFKHAPIPALFGLVAVILGFIAAWSLYAGAVTDPLVEKFPGLCKILRNKFYFDELYASLISLTQEALAKVANVLDQEFVGGLVRVVQGGTELAGRGLRLAQTGNLQTYSFLFAAGAAVVLYLMFGN